MICTAAQEKNRRSSNRNCHVEQKRLERGDELNKSLYTCGITHTAHTIEQMFCTQYDQFRKKQEYLIFAVGILFVALSILLPVSRPIRIFLLAIGGWIMVSRNLPAVIRASDSVQKRKSLPIYRYDFYEDHMRMSGEGSMCLEYRDIIRLVEEKRYYYLFTGPSTVMMLDRKELGEEDEGFRKFLEDKTGKKFCRAHSILMVTLQDLLRRG